jgi:hypothetical protein
MPTDARELPPIPYTKKDQYCTPYYRVWAPASSQGGGYPGEHNLVVLVEHYDYLDGLDNNNMEMEYLHVKDINRMMLNNKDQGWKEVPTAIKYGSHVMFVEDAKHRQNRIRMEEQMRVEASLAEAAATPGNKTHDQEDHEAAAPPRRVQDHLAPQLRRHGGLRQVHDGPRRKPAAAPVGRLVVVVVVACRRFLAWASLLW